MEKTIDIPIKVNMNLKWAHEYGDRNDDLVIDEITITKFRYDSYSIRMFIISNAAKKFRLSAIVLENLIEDAVYKLESSYIYSITRQLYEEFNNDRYYRE